MWRVVPGRKKPVLDHAYAAWIKAAAWEVKMQAVDAPRIDGRFDVRIEVPISRRDTDNWAKPLMDLMQHAGVISNDGNMNVVTITPMDREDCSVALFERPDLGNVRAPSKARKRTGGPAPKPSRRRLDALAAVRGRVPF